MMTKTSTDLKPKYGKLEGAIRQYIEGLERNKEHSTDVIYNKFQEHSKHTLSQYLYKLKREGFIVKGTTNKWFKLLESIRNRNNG